ncbi:MAG: 50S ribosome-binding GTPase [Arenicellales bacterium]|nr:50S ribosome-binding GTPase [Arenicellales bacterium]
MNIDFDRDYTAVKRWVATAHSMGWLDASDVEALDKMETASAEDLFTNRNRRPLIVGLFGGTGVGKSSLLNRLAGRAIAEVGVERPTSRRATIYLHESQSISALPQNSPAMHTDIKYHDVQDKREVAWLDMPDIDSVERSNRELALAWLPYIDWLIYVTSPERYRDDAGWRLVKQRHHRHHWLFVINHWDEATESQFEEFLLDLINGGFAEPQILRTNCANQVDDDFDQLEHIIKDAIRRHGLAELQRIGVLAKLEELQTTTCHYLQKIGSERQWEKLRAKIKDTTSQRLTLCRERLEGEIESIVQHYPKALSFWRAVPSLPKLPESELEQAVWSNYCDHLLDNVSAGAVIALEEEGISSEPIDLLFSERLTSAKETVLKKMSGGLKAALTQPGIPVQRVLRRTMRFLSYALPAVVGVVILYNVVTQYQLGLTGEKPFLGINFAVHSILLIVLAWFIPFLLSRWLRSSPRTTARRGLRSGLNEAINTIEHDLLDAYDALEQDREKLIKALPKVSIE